MSRFILEREPWSLWQIPQNSKQQIFAAGCLAVRQDQTKRRASTIGCIRCQAMIFNPPEQVISIDTGPISDVLMQASLLHAGFHEPPQLSVTDELSGGPGCFG